MTDFGDFGSVQIGRLPLREALSMASETASAGTRQLKLTGQEAVPALTAAELARVQDDLPGMVGAMVPVVFTHKVSRNGYYEVLDVQADLMDWNGELVTCTWSATLARIGSDTEIDLESRLSGALARDNAYAATGERIHVPPIGHYAYFAGFSQPSVLIRSGSDGAMLVYRGVDVTANPRWGCPVETYLAGRVRVLDAHNLERSGISFPVRPPSPPLVPSTQLAPSPGLAPASGHVTGWALHNTLVQVGPAATAGVLDISAWTDGAWQAKSWDILIGGASLGSPDTVTVLRNEPEIAVVRLLRSQNPGRVTVDLTMRRGHRTVEIYVQAEYSTTIKLVVPGDGEAGVSPVAGHVRAAVNDDAGNRYVIGSASTFTADTTRGGISVSSAVALDAFIGVEAGGSGAISGDRAADLFNSYLAAPAETVSGVRR